MTQNGHFTRLELVGATKEEALANAPFGIQKNATQAFENWKKKQTGIISDAAVKQFMIDYLDRETKGLPGVGCYIVREAAVKDTRKRPYEITDIKNEQGARQYKTVYRWIDDATGQVVVESDKTKADAKNRLKEAYSEKGYRGNATLEMVKVCVKGQAIVAKARYTPSKSATNGEYIAFGVVAD